MEKENNKSTNHLFYLIFSIFSSFASSSCCLIQLLLNLFSLGCAGFSVLDDYQPIFLSLTLISLVQLYRKRSSHTKNFLFIITLCVLIISSKHLLTWLNMNPNLFSADPISSQSSFIVQNVYCQACAKKLCDDLSNIVNYCKIELIEEPMANLTVVLEKNISIEQLKKAVESILNHDFLIVDK